MKGISSIYRLPRSILFSTTTLYVQYIQILWCSLHLRTIETLSPSPPSMFTTFYYFSSRPIMGPSAGHSIPPLRTIVFYSPLPPSLFSMVQLLFSLVPSPRLIGCRSFCPFIMKQPPLHCHPLSDSDMFDYCAWQKSFTCAGMLRT